MDVKEQDILGEDIATHWYYVAKGRAMRALLAGIPCREILDVGAGSGVFSRQLIDAGSCTRSVCVDPAYETERTEQHGAGTLLFVRGIENPTQDLILMMDVLEHVEDDVGLLRTYTSTLPPGGHVLISVPAFRFLWSGHDVFLEHHRRYTLGQIEAVVRAAGLDVVRGRYFFGLLFPVAASIRLAQARRLAAGQIEPASALKRAPKALNAALVAVHDIERAMLLPFNRLAGLTAFCLARRR